MENELIIYDTVDSITLYKNNNSIELNKKEITKLSEYLDGRNAKFIIASFLMQKELENAKEQSTTD